MGGVRDLMPFTHMLMLIGTVAITGVGIPAALSFRRAVRHAGLCLQGHRLSKAHSRPLKRAARWRRFAFVMGILAAVLTSFYSWRLIYLTFWGRSRAPEEVRKHPHAVPDAMMIPLVPLALGALWSPAWRFTATSPARSRRPVLEWRALYQRQPP